MRRRRLQTVVGVDRKTNTATSLRKCENGFHDFPAGLVGDGLIDLLEGILGDEFVEGKAAAHVQFDQVWDEGVWGAIALDDSANANCRRSSLLTDSILGFPQAQ